MSYRPSRTRLDGRPDPGPIVGRRAVGIGDMVADHSLTPNNGAGWPAS
jgi:hypothetical protein